MNARKAKVLRKRALEIIEMNAGKVLPEGYVKGNTTGMIMCRPKGPRWIYKEVKKAYKQWEARERGMPFTLEPCAEVIDHFIERGLIPKTPGFTLVESLGPG